MRALQETGTLKGALPKNRDTREGDKGANTDGPHLCCEGGPFTPFAVKGPEVADC